MLKKISLFNIIFLVYIINFFVKNNNNNILIGLSLFSILCEILYLKYKKNLFLINSSILISIISSYIFKVYYFEIINYICVVMLSINLYRLIIILKLRREISSYILLFLIPYTIEKSLVYKVYTLKKEILFINIFLTFILFFYNMKRLKINKKNLLDESLRVLILLYPFFLIKRGSSDEIHFFISILILFKVIINRKNKKIKFERLLMLLSILSIFGIILSLFNNRISQYTLVHLKEYINNIGIFILLLLLNKKNIDINKILKNTYLCLLLIICNIYPILLETNFTFGRISGNWNISTYSFIVGLFTVILLYINLINKKYDLLLITILLYVLVLFSGTRMIWLIVIAISMLICILSNNIKIYIGAFFVVIVLGLSYKSLENNNPIKARIKTYFHIKTNTSSGSRIYMYKEAIEQFKQKPITGNGFVTYGERAYTRHQEELNNRQLENYDKIQEAYGNYRYHAHSNFFEMLCGTGVIGTGLFYLLNFTIFWILISNRIKKNNITICEIGILIFIFYHLYGVSDATIYMKRVSELYYWFIGVILSYIRKGDLDNVKRSTNKNV